MGLKAAAQILMDFLPAGADVTEQGFFPLEKEYYLFNAVTVKSVPTR